MHEYTQVLLAAIGFIGIGCHWLAWRVKLPAIIFLLLAGILAGPVTGLIHPDKLFGDLLFPFVSLGVAVILFEGGLTLKLHEIKGLGSAVVNLLTLGVALTWAIAALVVGLTPYPASCKMVTINFRSADESSTTRISLAFM